MSRVVGAGWLWCCPRHHDKMHRSKYCQCMYMMPICLVYTWHKTWRKVPCEHKMSYIRYMNDIPDTWHSGMSYIWYVLDIYHGINMVDDDINSIPGIYPLKTFSDISVPVTYPSGYGIHLVYDLCRHNLTHKPCLYHGYIWYIPDIWHSWMPYIWYMTYIYLVYDILSSHGTFLHVIRYISELCHLSTWNLMLLCRTRIRWPGHYSSFFNRSHSDSPQQDNRRENCKKNTLVVCNQFRHRWWYGILLVYTRYWFRKQ